MRRIGALLATLVLTALSVVGVQPHADAGFLAGSVKHYSPDDGYDPPLIVTCDGSEDFGIGIAEGHSSKEVCGDTSGIIVRPGEEVWCKILYQGDGSVYLWQKKFDATGWHGIGNYWEDGAGCTLRLDSSSTSTRR